MSASLRGMGCVRCALKGHRCQAQIWEDGKPLCLRCADGEPCCYETAAALEETDRYRERIEVFDVPMPTSADRSLAQSWGKPKSLYSDCGRTRKSYLSEAEQAQVLEDLRTMTARETADKNKIPITTVQSLRSRQIARMQLAGQRAPRVPSGANQKVKRIREMVEDHFGLDRGSLQKGSQRMEFVVPRQIVMYLAVEVVHASLMTTASTMGKMHHTTVLHAIRKIGEGIKVNNGLRDTVELLKTAVEQELRLVA